MDINPHIQPFAQPEPRDLMDITTTAENLKALLQTKDDTQRFVGLALLKSLLDNGQLIQDSERVCELWDALSPTFLDRLLRAHRNEKLSRSEAQDMVDLAVSVIHTFTVILPENTRRQKRLIGRTPALVKALVDSPPETTKLILQILLTISSHSEGSLELLRMDDISPLTEIAAQYAIILDIIGYTWTTASTIATEEVAVRKSVDKIMPILLNVFQGTDAVTFIAFTGSTLSKINPECLPQNPKWLNKLVSTLRKLVVSRPTLAGRAAYTHLASTLLQSYPAMSPTLLFKDDIIQGPESKPFSFLFCSLLLIDLRSSFPSLLSQLNSSKYLEISQRLEAGFNVISSFIAFLVKSLDDDSSVLSMPPDFLLRLRKDLAETMSLTIEYLRDRWDASIAGVSGLHPSARTGTAATSEGTRLTLTWESIKDNVISDPLILAAIRTLGVWIREDENENLRNETAGLMDMFIELYRISPSEIFDFRYPILLALEGLIITDEGVDRFLGQEGWEVVIQDLENILTNSVNQQMLDSSSVISEAGRGLQIIRVLLAVLDHPSISSPREDWMPVVTLVASMKPPSRASTSMILELQIAMLQLSTALLSKAAGNMQRRFIANRSALSGLLTRLEEAVGGMEDKSLSTELSELLEDIALDLENLMFNG